MFKLERRHRSPGLTDAVREGSSGDAAGSLTHTRLIGELVIGGG
jgi:hypothetical protein